MIIEKTNIEGITILIPEKFYDNRGYFQETYNDKLYNEILKELNNSFVQDNESCSKKGVVRGMHWQINPMAQSKLIRCLNGRIIDIVCDIRKNSSTFGQFVTIELTPENNKQVFIPRGFAHGFISLEDNSILSYKVDNYYSKECERSFNIFSIKDFDNEVFLSDKDRNAPNFNELKDTDLF